MRDIQMHPYKQAVLHVDFQRIDPKKKIHMKVPLHFINSEIAPGVKTSGGIVSHVLTEVDVTCLPKDLPEYITVDLIDLAAGHTLHLSDVKVPDDVEITALSKGDDQAVAAIAIHVQRWPAALEKKEKVREKQKLNKIRSVQSLKICWMISSNLKPADFYYV